MSECRFLRASTAAQEVVCLSAVVAFWCHWDSSLPGLRGCASGNCYLCAEGYGLQLRALVRVRTEAGEHAILELRDRHRSIIAELEGQGRSVVGQVLRVRRSGSARNSPVDVEVLHAVPVQGVFQVDQLVRKVVASAITLRPVEVEADI